MRNSLFTETDKEIDIDQVLRGTCQWLIWSGIEAVSEDVVASKLAKGGKGPTFHGHLHTPVEISFKNTGPHILITRFETEINPAYSTFTKPFTICVSVWTGAESIGHLVTACVAAAIADEVEGKILDSEHIWSNLDLNEVVEFMEKARQKYAE